MAEIGEPIRRVVRTEPEVPAVQPAPTHEPERKPAHEPERKPEKVP
jgi:hypothetical protein